MRRTAISSASSLAATWRDCPTSSPTRTPIWCYDGRWFTPTRDALDAFVARVQQRVTGTVRVKLFHGDVRVVGRTSPFAQYEAALATQEGGDRFDRAAAAGFVRMLGGPVEIAARAASAPDRAAPGRSSRESLNMSTLWSGRFDTAPDAAVFEFGASFPFDRRLFEDDVTGSLAWADALAHAGVLSPEDAPRSPAR